MAQYSVVLYKDCSTMDVCKVKCAAYNQQYSVNHTAAQMICAMAKTMVKKVGPLSHILNLRYWHWIKAREDGNPFPMFEVKISGETDLFHLNSVNPLVTGGGGKEISFPAFILRGQRFQELFLV